LKASFAALFNVKVKDWFLLKLAFEALTHDVLSAEDVVRKLPPVHP
jgi:hypothetical protein